MLIAVSGSMSHWIARPSNSAIRSTRAPTPRRRRVAVFSRWLQACRHHPTELTVGVGEPRSQLLAALGLREGLGSGHDVRAILGEGGQEPVQAAAQPLGGGCVGHVRGGHRGLAPASQRLDDRVVQQALLGPEVVVDRREVQPRRLPEGWLVAPAIPLVHRDPSCSPIPTTSGPSAS